MLFLDAVSVITGPDVLALVSWFSFTRLDWAWFPVSATLMLIASLLFTSLLSSADDVPGTAVVDEFVELLSEKGIN